MLCWFLAASDWTAACAVFSAFCALVTAAWALARVWVFCTWVSDCWACAVLTLAPVEVGLDCAALTCLAATLLLAEATSWALFAAVWAFARTRCAFCTATWSAWLAAVICNCAALNAACALARFVCAF